MLKCIIWDLDNTIWLGTLLEDACVELKEEAVRLIKKAQSRGIIQTICSKNDYEMAMNKIISFGMETYFVYPQISFRPKSEAIKQFLNSMHLRAKDTLFIDDMTFELNEVKFAVPEISVMNILNWKEIAQEIEKERVCEENQVLKRIQFYKNEEKRLFEKNKYQDISEFFMQSDFTIHFELACEADLKRIKELLERSHQLNTTGIIYYDEEIRDMIQNEEWIIVVGEVKDKYGEYGKSAVLIMHKEDRSLTVKVMIVSCRLLGKGVSNYLLYYVYGMARRNGFKTLNVEYKKNKYNRSMQVLLQMCNFKKYLSTNEKYKFSMNIETGTVIKKPEWIKEV